MKETARDVDRVSKVGASVQKGSGDPQIAALSEQIRVLQGGFEGLRTEMRDWMADMSSMIAAALQGSPVGSGPRGGSVSETEPDPEVDSARGAVVDPLVESTREGEGEERERSSLELVVGRPNSADGSLSGMFAHRLRKERA